MPPLAKQCQQWPKCTSSIVPSLVRGFLFNSVCHCLVHALRLKGNPSSRLVPVTNCFQAVSSARRLGGALVCRPPPRPLAWSPNIAYCLWLSAGLPTIPSVTIPTYMQSSPSFFWRMCLSFECKIRRMGIVRGDSRNMNNFDCTSLSGPKRAWRPHEFP